MNNIKTATELFNKKYFGTIKFYIQAIRITSQVVKEKTYFQIHYMTQSVNKKI
jgi:hypothetical protein